MTKHKKIKAHTQYELKDNAITRKNLVCPRCKSFLANHNNRKFCGNCGYSEQKKDSNKEEKKE